MEETRLRTLAYDFYLLAHEFGTSGGEGLRERALELHAELDTHLPTDDLRRRYLPELRARLDGPGDVPRWGRQYIS